MRRRSLTPLLLAGWLLAGPATPGGSEDGEVLVPGPPRERPITEGETHVYRVAAGEDPVLVLVEQRGIDLVLEARGAAERFTADAPNIRWGPEVLLLPAGAAGGYRIEVRPSQKSVPPGRYAIQAETLTGTAPEDAKRASALEAMSRAGQLVPGSPELRGEGISAYRKVLADWQALGERRWEAEAVLNLAQLEQQAGDLRAAVADYQKALALWRDLSDSRRVAAVQGSLGLALWASGDIEGARGTLEEARALWRSLEENAAETETRNNLCLLDLTIGALPAARACFEELVALYRESGQRAGEAAALTNLGAVHDQMGDPDTALEHYGQALSLWQALGNRTEEARTLNNLAVVHRTLGNWQEALRRYGEVREILPAIGDRTFKASLLNNVGFAYSSLGEPQRARAILEEALELRRAAGDRRGEINTLSNLGVTWRELGDLERALSHHRQALAQAVALGDRRQEAQARLGLSEALLDHGDAAAALRELDPALAHFREAGLRGREAQALRLQGRALARAGRSLDGLAVLRESLERCRTLRDRVGEAETLHALARVERSLGLLDEAGSHADQAVARVEELRTGFVSPDLRAAFLATRRRVYELRIDLHMDRHLRDPEGGHDRQAFEKSEQARARTLLDTLQAGSRRSSSPAPAGLLQKRQSLRHRLSAKAAQQVRQGGEGLEREMEALRAELDAIEAEVRRHDPLSATLGASPQVGIEEIADLLEPGTLLLEYALGEERSFVWVLGAAGLRSFELPPRQEIEGLVRQVHAELSTVEAGAAASPTAEALSRKLLGPVWGETAQVRRLIVVPDGALHVLPFAALPVPEPGRPWEDPAGLRDLVERQEVVYLPSATTLALQRQRLAGRLPAPRLAAVFADPVFSSRDPRLGSSARADGPPPVFERLPSSRREAETIAALVPAGQVWSALDLAASREAVVSGELRSYRFIHLATHAVADTRNPDLSGLVLSLVDAAGRPQEGFLGVADLYELDLAADLVVLSGCRTGLGREIRGEGLMGLTRGFLHAGVPRVVGSLWPVQDRASAELMSRFYKGLWQGGLPPAAALREAQLSLRDDRRYRDPYSWAAFVLQGDWR